VNLLDPGTLLASSVLELRGDGKAGGGLVLAFQSLAGLVLRHPGTHVQEWPFFSSARRGANIRSFLRLSRQPIDKACEVSRPALSVLMDEGAAKAIDFALGVPEGGTFVLNTRHSPEECARHYRLSGRVITVPGDDIGTTHLKHALGNVSVYFACARAIGGFSDEEIVGSFLASLERRHVPEAILERNRAALLATPATIRSGVFTEGAGAERNRPAAFPGYGALPIGAQTGLRLSRANRTANFAPSGFRLRFADPGDACTGCSHCITNCPEGIIRWLPDAERGVKVTGADVSSFCKLCGECVAVCPEHLFTQAAYEEHWTEEEEAAAP
jgi:Pyruvate/2-oxoacid:ferredoxin oxidoreductase gamma subunit/Pyruvate/2-oxoacid:ferredoxin oxidoreductase delta subunit